VGADSCPTTLWVRFTWSLTVTLVLRDQRPWGKVCALLSAILVLSASWILVTYLPISHPAWSRSNLWKNSPEASQTDIRSNWHHLWYALLQAHSATSSQQPLEWSVLSLGDCEFVTVKVILNHFHPHNVIIWNRSRDFFHSTSGGEIKNLLGIYIVVRSGEVHKHGQTPYLNNFSECRWNVSASYFITGDEMVSLNFKKHMETSLTDSSRNLFLNSVLFISSLIWAERQNLCNSITVVERMCKQAGLKLQFANPPTLHCTFSAKIAGQCYAESQFFWKMHRTFKTAVAAAMPIMNLPAV